MPKVVGMRLVITGTPGTGKTALAKAAAAILQCEAVDVNSLIKKERLYSRMEKGEMIADFGRLRGRLAQLLKGKKIILEGHLLSDLKLRADVVAVLRCRPSELRRRLLARKYPLHKIRENVLAEALDYCLLNSEKNYGRKKVMQVETTRKISASTLIKKIGKFLESGRSDSFRWLAGMEPGELLR